MNSFIYTLAFPEQSSELCAVVKGPCVCPLTAANTHVQGAQPRECSAPADEGLQRSAQAQHLPPQQNRDIFVAEVEAVKDINELK